MKIQIIALATFLMLVMASNTSNAQAKDSINTFKEKYVEVKEGNLI